MQTLQIKKTVIILIRLISLTSKYIPKHFYSRTTSVNVCQCTDVAMIRVVRYYVCKNSVTGETRFVADHGYSEHTTAY
jgi:hypothetical protein